MGAVPSNILSLSKPNWSLSAADDHELRDIRHRPRNRSAHHQRRITAAKQPRRDQRMRLGLHPSSRVKRSFSFFDAGTGNVKAQWRRVTPHGGLPNSHFDVAIPASMPVCAI